MITKSQMRETLEKLGADCIDTRPDRAHSIAATTVRFVKDGRRGVAVAGNVASQLDAFTDLIDLNLHDPSESLDPHHVWLWFAEDPDDRETEVAFRTLARNVRDLVTVHLRAITADGELRAVDTEHLPWSDSGHYSYGQWAELLAAVPAEPPALVRDLILATGRPEYRAYPMLSSRGKRWSIRLEGLQVGVCSATKGRLSVGRDGKKGGTSHHRARWLSVAGWSPVDVDLSVGSMEKAAALLQAFADSPPVNHAATGEQDEHALESRILRGDVRLNTPAGAPLELMRSHSFPEQEPSVVNWGSQFPTRWGVRTAAARYLDGMLHVGRTPWALEMKVKGISGELYYRHAIHQAVLYRDFIREATPLKDWFDRFDLDQAACEAAVVVPQGQTAEAEARLRAVAAAFGVALIVVPVEAARRPGA
ncbi:hypothetical protein ACT17Q_15735 [Cellulomonas sp. CW35]|uniref:hypothetical protein n=1 Tax=Cellulomonas sp. CW35 TaxID=3458249 RepID=UPI004034732D